MEDCRDILILNDDGTVVEGCRDKKATKIIIPEGVVSIKGGALGDCKELTSIEIPNSVTEIDYFAFALYNHSTFQFQGWITNLISIIVAKENPVYDSRDSCNAIIKTDSNTLIAGCKKSVIPNSITSIGNYAFHGCTGLTSIEIPNSVTSIGDYAFNGCTGLTSIEIPNSVTSIGYQAFYGCTGLTSIEIPNSVTSIGSKLFYGCTGLTSIEIPNSVTSIGDYAFNGCTGLTSIEIPNSVTSIGKFAFYGCTGLTSIDIPNSVTSIGDNAFTGCTGLTAIEIPNSVTNIGDWAFCCTGLTSVIVAKENAIYDSRDSCNAIIETNSNTIITGCKNSVIPNSVTSIGGGAFSGCTGLTSIEIPNSVTSIGIEAFHGCTGLTSIEIPNSVMSIGNSAFDGCTGLISVIVAKENTIYDSRDNCNAIIKTDSNTLIAGCKKSVIPNSITSIGNYAFHGCTGLTSIEIPNTVKEIGWSAFSGCTGLTSIEIPNSVTNIGYGAFCRTGLISIEIPNSITSIGEFAFFNCTGMKTLRLSKNLRTIGLYAFSKVQLKRLHIQNEDPLEIDIDRFVLSNPKDCTLYVPIGTGYAYRHHPKFKGKFKEIVIEQEETEDKQPPCESFQAEPCPRLRLKRKLRRKGI